MIESIGYSALFLIIVVTIGIVALVIKTYRKATQGQALVKTGAGGTKFPLMVFLLFQCFTAWRLWILP